jgi:hypothetical protein
MKFSPSRVICGPGARLPRPPRLAEKQYRLVDAENRLVAAELERRREQALQALRQGEEQAACSAETKPETLTAELRRQWDEAHPTLRQLWDKGELTNVRKKELLRVLIDKVILIEHNRPGEPTDPIETLRGGDRRALATVFDRYRDRLRRMMELRLGPRLRGRLDVSDFVREAFLEVALHVDAYLVGPKAPRAALAAPAYRPADDDVASPAPGRADAGSGAGVLDLSRRPASDQLDRAGIDAPGPALRRPTRLNAPSKCCVSRRRRIVSTPLTATCLR